MPTTSDLPSRGIAADEAAFIQSAASGQGTGEVADWKWTLMLFSHGFDWRQIMRIRRMQDEELAASLCLALRQGGELEPGWVSPTEDSERTPGQQRVWREMRRRTSAGVG